MATKRCSRSVREMPSEAMNAISSRSSASMKPSHSLSKKRQASRNGSPEGPSDDDLPAQQLQGNNNLSCSSKLHSISGPDMTTPYTLQPVQPPDENQILNFVMCLQLLRSMQFCCMNALYGLMSCLPEAVTDDLKCWTR